MKAAYQRISSNKLTFTILLVFGIYLILRAIAFYQYQSTDFKGDFFNYNGKSVRYVCQGTGEPFVFLETGFGSDSEVTWATIVDALPETFTTCYYDRLGHGGSDTVPPTFTTEQKSQLQEALIQHVAGDSPVVIVAKSYGGIIARRTAARAEINLAALIFLDSAHENQHEIMRGTIDPIPDYVKVWHYADAVLGLSDIKNVFKSYDSATSKRLDQFYSSLSYAQVLSTYRNEKGFYTALESFNYDFGDLKLLVLSHDREAYASNPRLYSVGADWAEMQKAIAGLSDNSEHIVVPGSTHNMTADAPEFVVSKIISTVAGVSSDTEN